MWLFCVFFFKQKTTYEVRISDWSSDVCSSDLYLLFCAALACSYKASACLSAALRIDRDCASKASARLSAASRIDLACSSSRVALMSAWRSRFRPCRSEEHTSELQSLMRISYAVFCLKKKNTDIYNYYVI